MNPCRCGHLGQKDKECSRAPVCAQEYMSKISGPLLDRIDLKIDVEKAKKWIANGAQPTDTVRALLKKQDIIK